MTGSAQVVVEPMHESDLVAVLAIDAAAFHEPRAAREEHFREELARPWARLRVARGDGAVVLGYSLYWHVADEIHLLDVAVLPSARRRGIGAALVGELIRYARERGAAKILLEVRASNAAAVALYERCGFSRFNVRPRYYPDDEDAIEMMLTP